MAWTDLLDNTTFNVYDNLMQSLTNSEGLCLQEYYSLLQSLITQGSLTYGGFTSSSVQAATSIQECVTSEIALNLTQYTDDPESKITKDTLLSLKLLGLVASKDDRHYNLTKLGADFLDYVNSL